jgi:hypothetical protein
MLRRRSAVDRQLASLHLYAHNVEGDGNCLFRAASYAMHGTEIYHEKIRASAACQILQHQPSISAMFGLNDLQFNKLALDVTSPGTAAGEQVLSVLPTVLNRDIIVHIAYAEPQKFSFISSSSSCSPAHPPIQVAFYDGVNGGEGHYKAVLPMLPPLSMPPHSTSGCSIFQPSSSLLNQSPLSPTHLNWTPPLLARQGQ